MKRGRLALAALALIGAGTAWWFANEIWGEGPYLQEPVSSGDGAVRWIWCGDPMSGGFRVRFRTDRADADGAVLLVSRDEDLSDAQRFPATVEPTRPAIGRVSCDGLDPDTLYHYAVEHLGSVDHARKGSVVTAPDRAANFSFAFSSCARTGSNSAVFDTIRQRAPHLFVHLGDLHYGNIEDDDVHSYGALFERVLRTPRQAQLFRSTAVAYVWDDHDYGPNNSDRTSPSRRAAQAVWRETVPHGPLPDDEAIYRTFDVGRARFILTDARSERSPRDVLDGADKTMLGPAQVRWLKKTLTKARDDERLIIWANSVPWIAAREEGADHWGGHSRERRELSRFIERLEWPALVMISADAHMVALDDGTHNAFGMDGGPGFPVFHGAALDRWGSEKGGPYSHGTHPGGGQFGWVNVEDDGGDSVTVRFRGFRHPNTVLVDATFELPLSAADH